MSLTRTQSNLVCKRGHEIDLYTRETSNERLSFASTHPAFLASCCTVIPIMTHTPLSHVGRV